MKLLSIVLAVAVLSFMLSCNKTTKPSSNVVRSPVFTPSGGTYAIGQTIEMSCATAGVEIRYTLDGSEPGAMSLLYVTPLVIPTIFPANTDTCTVKAKAYKEGYDPSATQTATYTVTYANTVVAPVITPPGGDIAIGSQVSISCFTADALIHYTLDGSEPAITSNLYSQPFLIEQSGQVSVKAKAYRDTWNPSATASMNYTVTGPVPAMVSVTGGTFNNGTSDVTLSSFYISKYELTQAEYVAVMGNNPSYFTGNTFRPVEQVTWFNAIEYCNRRSINESLTPCYSYLTYGTNPDSWPGGWNSDYNNHTNVSCSWTANGYRLPSEAEWQYAAMGGNQTHNYTYSGSNTIDVVAWYDSNSGSTTHTVGTKAANELGLFDMSGNVWELTWDIFSAYPSGAQTNPHGAISGSSRAVRGGGWYHSATHCIVSHRNNVNATTSDVSISFRCVRTSP